MQPGKKRPLQIAVIGGRDERDVVLKAAAEAGRLIVQQGAVLICGGMGGVMEAACKGAKYAGGTTVGILPGADAAQGNAYLDIVIPTGLGDARNALVLNAVSGVVAVGGKYGTLSEIGYALARELPIASLFSWKVDPAIYQAKDAEDAVSHVFKKLRSQG